MPRGITTSLPRSTAQMTELRGSGSSWIVRPTARAPGGSVSLTSEWLPRRSLSSVIMSPSDISCSIRLARMSAWLSATSTRNLASNSQALRGSLIVAIVRATLKRSRAMKHSDRFSASLAIDATSTCARADAGELERARVGGVALVDELRRQLAVDVREHLRAVLDEPHLVLLRREGQRQRRAGAAAAGDQDVHRQDSP